MSVFWLVLFIILLLIEIFTVGLVSIWFAVGAVVALISSLFIESAVIQGIIFVIVSLLTLLLAKKLTSNFKDFPVEPTNLDRVVGKRGKVTLKIIPGEVGQVKVLGNIWSAISSGEIEVGQKVIVKKIDGVKLIVVKEEE